MKTFVSLCILFFPFLSFGQCNCKNIYVWKFNDVSTKNASLETDMAETFEEVLTARKYCLVLERRNYATILMHEENETRIQSIKDMSNVSIKNLKLIKAEIVVLATTKFEEHDTTKRIINVRFVNIFTGQILAIGSISKPTIELTGYESLFHSLQQLMDKICGVDSISKDTVRTTNFQTIEIKNQEFLFTSVPWPFETNSKGEDYKGELTPESIRNQIVPLNPFNSQFPTIANNEQHLQFDLRKSGSTNLYVNKVFLEVTDVFNIDNKTMFFNAWLPKLETNKLEVVLSSNKKVFDIDMKDDVIEVLNNKPEFFYIKITGDKSCVNRIFKYRIVTSGVDENGNKFTIPSDRFYYLAFMPKDLDIPNLTPNAQSTTPLNPTPLNTTPLKDIRFDTIGIQGVPQGPGAPIDDAASLSYCNRFLQLIKDDPRSAENYLGDTIVVGPSLWKTATLGGVDTSGGIRFTFEDFNNGVNGRIFLSDKEALINLFSSDFFKYIASKHSINSCRATTVNERNLFYSMIYFEIAGKPVNIFDYGDSKLLIYFENGKVKWIDKFDYLMKEDNQDWVAHTLYRLGKTDSLIIGKISKTALPLEYEEPLIAKSYELSYEIFIKYFFVAVEDNLFMHMTKFLQDNPTNFKKFFFQALEYDKHYPIESGSFTFEMLCKIAIFYRDFTYDNSLIEKIKEFNGYKLGGGRYLIKKMLFTHENLHGDGESINWDAFKAQTGKSLYRGLVDSISLSLKLLKNGKIEAAYENYNQFVPEYLALQGIYLEQYVTADHQLSYFTNEIELNLFLYIILLKKHFQFDNAFAIVAYCQSKKMPYASVLMSGPFNFASRMAIAEKAYRLIPDVYVDDHKPNNQLFSQLLDEIICPKFSKFIKEYADLEKLIVEKQYKKAFDKSSSILASINSYKNSVINIEYCKNEILHIRAAIMAAKGNKTAAIKELSSVKTKFTLEQENALQSRILSVPEKYLLNDEINYKDSYAFYILKGMRNGRWAKEFLQD